MKSKFNDAGYKQLRQAAGVGVLEVMQKIVDTADVPDAPPYGVGLVKGGAAAAWVDGEKVGGEADAPAAAVTGTGIVGVFGWPFPARFQEEGTVNQSARPFATPTALAIADEAGAIITSAVKARIGGR